MQGHKFNVGCSVLSIKLTRHLTNTVFLTPEERKSNTDNGRTKSSSPKTRLIVRKILIILTITDLRHLDI